MLLLLLTLSVSLFLFVFFAEVWAAISCPIPNIQIKAAMPTKKLEPHIANITTKPKPM